MNPCLIDLNFPPDEEESAFDQHQPSSSIEGNTNAVLEYCFDDFVSDGLQEETELDMENPILMIISSSSPRSLVIDFHMDPQQDCETPLLELDIDQLREEDEQHIPENEEEEEDGQHIPENEEDESSTVQDTVDISQMRKRTFLSNEQRRAIYNALLEKSVNGRLKKKTTTEVSSLFSVNLRTVQRIWKQSKNTVGGGVVDVSHMRTKNCGRKRVHIDLNQVKDIPLNRRTTLRSLAIALNVRYSTLFRRVKEGLLHRHTNAIKPYLKEKNKIERLRFCLSMLDPRSMSLEPKFVDMYNVIHIDEKWFYMTKSSETYYLLPDEEEPLRTCQSKNFIGKVMFLAAMARPRFDDEGNEIFSGKIGIFPFVTEKPAERRSRNREAGTIEIKPMTSVNRDTIRAYLIEKVIPAIQEKWPREDSNLPIFIQQDNARTHINPGDEQFHMAASQHGLNIRLTCQPSNSPDLNILDLGFFNSIQALQQKECPRTVPELILAVEKSFNEYPPEKLNRVFVTLQLCMKEIMKIEGSNKYRIPHVNKDRLEREGRLPTQVSCDYDLVQNVRNMLA